jgi:hypothetical protein
MLILILLILSFAVVTLTRQPKWIRKVVGTASTWLIILPLEYIATLIAFAAFEEITNSGNNTNANANANDYDSNSSVRQQFAHVAMVYAVSRVPASFVTCFAVVRWSPKTLQVRNFFLNSSKFIFVLKRLFSNRFCECADIFWALSRLF